ncbi:hypothetical protein G5I_12881 [Acromyrmex echinatior]|uniref:Uncharacterized protein n=1 Tax=Acromyrmex echinatior TaxID=103372 RepID=F4X3J8_ACREC|nr:hypothetical protein G5I_12881 [Acromyrmex echinatior]
MEFKKPRQKPVCRYREAYARYTFGGLPIGLIAPTEHCGHFTDSPNIQWGFTDLTLAVKAGGLRIEHSSSACCVAETVRILKRNMGREHPPKELYANW